MLSLFADVVYVRPYSFTELAIWLVVVSAVIALVYIALKQFNISIPSWVVNIFWILLVAFVVIFAIRLVSSM